MILVEELPFAFPVTEAPGAEVAAEGRINLATGLKGGKGLKSEVFKACKAFKAADQVPLTRPSLRPKNQYPPLLDENTKFARPHFPLKRLSPTPISENFRSETWLDKSVKLGS